MPARRKSIVSVIGANLRSARLALDWSQEELAHRAGLHRTFVSSVERGERNISAENIQRLAHALGIEEVDLVRRDNHPSRKR